MTDDAGPRKGARSFSWFRKAAEPAADISSMGSYADQSSFDRRVALRGLAIVLGVIALAYATAWITVGRAGRFQELKGVFFSLDLPKTFQRIDQEGSGASITSLSESPSIERTFSSPLKAVDACGRLSR